MILSRFTIRTWDPDRQLFTHHEGLRTSVNLTCSQLKESIRELRSQGYTCHRLGNIYDGHADNDPSVLIEKSGPCEMRPSRVERPKQRLLLELK
jgi:hypothetical protein